MDDLDAEIDKAKREVAELKRKAEAKELWLKGLQRAAELRPAPQVIPDQSSDGLEGNEASDPDTTTGDAELDEMLGFTEKAEKRGGRQPGAISKQWRTILSDIFANQPVDLATIVLLASVHGLELQESSALSRMRHYLELGYVEETSDGRYRVTDAAIKRFDLKRKPAQSGS